MTERSPFDERLEVETPERVVLVHDLAGIGSRFAAGTIDATILFLPWCAVICTLIAVMPISDDLVPEELMAVGLAAVGACAAILFAYYLGFEVFMDGRTPGKRILRLRVIGTDGSPATTGAIVLRNLLRLADMLPTVFVHTLGGVVMFLNGRNQRIGDLAAGTVVVREREEQPRPRGALPAGPGHDDGGALPVAELAPVLDFLGRRGELRPPVRRAVGARMLADLTARHRLPPGDPETILGLLAAGWSPQRLRDAAGPAPGAAPVAGPAAPSAGARPATESPPSSPPSPDTTS